MRNFKLTMNRPYYDHGVQSCPSRGDDRRSVLSSSDSAHYHQFSSFLWSTMDPFTTTVPGSRYPVQIPVPSYKQLTVPPFDNPSSSKSPPVTLCRNEEQSVKLRRRKPPQPYKSPSSYDTFGLFLPDHIPSNNASSSKQVDKIIEVSGVSYDRSKNTPSLSLPLYHPLAPLAQSLPQLDPSYFGLPSNLSIDDHDVPIDDEETIQRLSSRARRNATKAREREDAEDQAPHASPRKRRGGGGGGGGSRRKRKEPDDGDATYPQPARRTRARNTAAAAASPLVGAAVVATSEAGDMDVASTADIPDVDDAQVEQESRYSGRTRRTRNTRKRRGSSASETTSTSVSVSIAANTKITKAARAEEAISVSVEVESRLEEEHVAEKREEEEPDSGHEAQVEPEPEPEPAPVAEKEVETGPKKPIESVIPTGIKDNGKETENKTTEKDMEIAPPQPLAKVVEPQVEDVEMVEKDEPVPEKKADPSPSSKQDVKTSAVPIPVEEEKEEGELSEESES
ncbi:hypothetical protein C8Q75DRAFT_98833 [Abortiporus biennis]|nr:hypothetical protein C8Q75DRAFT_98833 [Abortiporus biennis]